MYVARYVNNQVEVTDSSTGQVVRWFNGPPDGDMSRVRVEGREICIPDGNRQLAVYDIEAGQALRWLPE